MTGTAPKFINSPFFVNEPGNWHLKPGAPKEVEQEFTDFMQALQLEEAPDVTVEGILELLESDKFTYRVEVKSDK